MLVYAFVVAIPALWTYQEDDGDVEQEGAKTVEEEVQESDMVHLLHGDLGDLPEEADSQVHDRAHGGEIVQRDQRVHLELSRAEKTLNHGQTQSLEGNTGHLENEADQDELDLSERGDDNTNNDGGNIEEDSEVWLRDTKSPARQKHSDGSSSLGGGDVRIRGCRKHEC